MKINNNIIIIVLHCAQCAIIVDPFQMTAGLALKELLDQSMMVAGQHEPSELWKGKP